MEAVISPQSMHAFDQVTMKKDNITSFELMTRAAKKLNAQFISDFSDRSKHILILAGLGNNGGDGMMLGHFLKEAGYPVSLFCVGKVDKIRGESKEALTFHDTYNVITSLEDINTLKTALSDNAVVIDALFGLGLSRNIEGIYCDVIDTVNASPVKVISIDFPSGIDPYSGHVRGVAIKANTTYIIQTYKYGNLLTDALDYHGQKTCVDIGIEITHAEGTLLRHTTILPRVMTRAHNTHKYDYGSVLIVGGSKTMIGAPNLSALAALRSGAGLVTIAYDDTTFDYRVMPRMEIMHTSYQPDAVEHVLGKTTAIAFGMGLGKNNPTHKATLKTLLNTDIPMVIDADGLSYFGELKDDVTVDKPVVLTPHFGELLSLLDTDKDAFYPSWVDKVKTFVKHYNVTLLIKGPVSMIITKDHMAFSPYGNPGMATAGSGDVLTGILASRIAQNNDVKQAIEDGLVLHGYCGDIAENTSNSMSMIAGDIIEAMTKLTRQP